MASAKKMKMASKQVSCVVPVKEMCRFVVDCMTSVGTNPDHANQVADLLITADLRGHYSHGLNRLPIYMEDVASGNCKGNGQPKILKQKGGTAWVDGDNALGAVVGNFCTDLAVKLAKEHGIGWVVAKGSNHFGIAGYYPLRMSREHGFIGMAFTNTSPLVYANRSAEVGLGTNPISCIAPATNGDEFALDMATTTVALGKVEWAKTKGVKIPKMWGADSSGQPTDDPDKVINGGALLPLGGTEETGGYKGTGLSMMVELFCGMMAGSMYGKNVRKWREVSRVADCGQCFVAIDPGCFAPGFPERLQTFMNETRNLKPADPNFPVLVAGDPERINIEKSEKAGGIIYPHVQHLESIANQYKIRLFEYKKVEL